MSEQAYPLQWPEGWPRTKYRKYGRFATKERTSNSYQRTKDITIAQAIDRIEQEFDRLGAANLIISTNLRVRKSDGRPASDQRQPEDPGAAVYFELGGKRQCVPCDSYTQVAQNLAGIAATIEALRALDRHGSGLMERAFTGFTALPDQTSGAWWAILGVEPSASGSEVDAAYKLKRRDAHPDKGGSDEAFSRVTEAWNQYRKAAGQN